MQNKPSKAYPPLKVCEWSKKQGGGAYIAFEENINIPGLESANIRFEFSEDNSMKTVESLAKALKKAGFTFVVQ
ncbi:hypothetical protein [Vibrio parahaemolyticus]|uniref:hypothetical protein n=1 Tax=Vibrio parahaemolyticus TaxID=670 RepID=UPI00387A8F12